MLKKFICLAKSVREGAWCVAGKEVVSGKITDWIRPVGREKEALTIDNFEFGIGSILSCDVDLHSPSDVQKENFIISENPNWQSWGYFPKDKLAKLVDTPDTLWQVGNNCSSLHGVNDKVEEFSHIIVGNSLYFIMVDCVILAKQDESYDEKNRTRMRMTFHYNNYVYSLSLTYPHLSKYYWDKLEVGQSVILGPSYLTVSLAKPYRGFCYKVVAGHVFV